jgi:protein-S-isoprenylcysteine O-methyltransferase Ste14
MAPFTSIILMMYVFFYITIIFVGRSILVGIQIGKSPFVFPDGDSAYALIGKYFKITIAAMIFYVLAMAFIPTFQQLVLPFSYFEMNELMITGIVILSFSFFWTIIAQYNMHTSWRIGIDSDKTDLITTGLFRYSRNPVFLGMILTLLGLFLVTPNAFTLLFLIVGYVLIQIQIRLEEEHLEREHGKPYREYKQQVRRLI